MLKNFRDRIALSGVTVLMIGVALLIFTFLSAYGFLTESFDIIATGDLVRTFGEALAPLIATSIHIMYLGVMGWIASLITIRGVTIIANAPKLEALPVVPQKPAVAPVQPQPATQKPKAEPQKETKPPEPKPPEAKPSEPEIIVIPPEEVAPQQQAPPQPQQPQQQNNNQQK